jgi:hypothetical protein
MGKQVKTDKKKKISVSYRESTMRDVESYRVEAMRSNFSDTSEYLILIGLEAVRGNLK